LDSETESSALSESDPKLFKHPKDMNNTDFEASFLKNCRPNDKYRIIDHKYENKDFLSYLIEQNNQSASI